MTLAAQRAMHGETDVVERAADLRLKTSVAGGDGPPVILVAQRAEALGDAILRIPAYRAIRCAFPSHRVVGVYRGHSVFSSVLSRVRPLFLDDLFEMQGQTGKTHVGSVARALGNVDTIIDFSSSLQVLFNYLASLRVSRRYVANVPGFLLRRGVPARLEPRMLDNAHRYHRLVELVARRALPFDASLPLLPRADVQIEAMLPRGQRYIGIAPGRPTSWKYWPLDRHIAVAARCREMGMRPVFLLGPYPDESQQREPLQRAIPEAIFIDKDIAENDPSYLPWLFHAAAMRFVACLGVDGGICHLVSTHNIPVATLTGPIGARYWRPVTQHFWNIDAGRFGSREMEAIPVEAVIDVVDEMVAWQRQHGERFGRTANVA